jgi:P-type Cu+ transporter
MGYTDIVCGMEIDPKSAPGHTEYEGEDYFFCSKGCEQRFEIDPGQFLENEDGNESAA